MLIAFLKSLYRRFILYRILSLIHGTDVFLILTASNGHGVGAYHGYFLFQGKITKRAFQLWALVGNRTYNIK